MKHMNMPASSLDIMMEVRGWTEEEKEDGEEGVALPRRYVGHRERWGNRVGGGSSRAGRRVFGSRRGWR